MKLTNQQTLHTSINQVWEALNNPDVLQECIPGCESFNAISPNHYEMTVLAAIGPVKAKFKGKLTLSDIQVPTSYKINFEGQGGAAGYGKGSAIVTLEETTDDETILHYTANASVGGKIAQIGQRLVDMAAQRMATDFFKKFNTVLETKRDLSETEQTEATNIDPTAADDDNWLGRSKRWLKNLSNS